MKALGEIQVIPIGVGVSVRREVMRAHEIISRAALKTQLHAYGTNVEVVKVFCQENNALRLV